MSNWYRKILDTFLLISGGTPEDINSVNKWGLSNDIDTTDVPGQIIWPIKKSVQSYMFIDSPIQLRIKSTSANDTLTGTGAQKVNVLYQDSEGSEVSEIIELNGVTPINLLDASYGVFRMFISQTGSNNVNEGQIIIEDSSSNVYATIEISEGQTQIAVYRIPNNKKGKIVSHTCSFGRTGPVSTASMRLRIRKTDGSILTKHDPYLTTNLTNDIKDYKIGGIDINPGEWIYWECIAVGANDVPIRASFDIRLEDI